MDMKREIAKVAMHLFARHGYAATSMREIAEAAHLTKAALYHHYPDKDTLYRESMAELSERLCARIAEAAAEADDPVDRLCRIVRRHLELFVEEGDMIRALYHNLLMPDSSLEVRAGEEEEHPLMGAVRACAKAGHLKSARVEDVFLLIVGAVEYSGVRWLLDRRAPKPSAALGDRIVAAALPTLAPEIARSTASHARTPRSTRRRTVAIALFLGSGFFVASPAVAADPGGEPEAAATVEVIPGASDAMTLEACIARALDANAALGAERRGRGELAGQKLQALSLGLPSVDVVGTFSRSRDPSFALDETFGGGDGDEAGTDSIPFDFFVVNPEDVPAQSFWRASVDAQWEINPSLIWNAVGAANLGGERQRAIIEDSEHRTAESTLAAYYRVLHAADQVEAVAAERRAREEFRDITRRRFAVDFATALDTLQAAVSLANILPEHRRASLDVRNAGAELNVLMGRPALEPLTLARDVRVETVEVHPDRAVALALARPDVRQLTLLERIFAKNRGAQKAEHRPYVSLSGSYGYVARAFDDLGDDGKDTWRVSAGLTVPIFDGLLTRGRVKESDARIQRTALERLEAERRARLEVLTLLGELDVARDDLAAAEMNMTRAEDALRITTLTYENGKADYLSVLNARADRFQARSNLIRARFAVLSATSSLKRAMGAMPTTPLDALLDETPVSDGRSD
jgi:outer membrane protein TolC